MSDFLGWFTRLQHLDEMGGSEKNRSLIKNRFNRCLCVVKIILKCPLYGKKQTALCPYSQVSIHGRHARIWARIFGLEQRERGWRRGPGWRWKCQEISFSLAILESILIPANTYRSISE